MRLCVRWLHVCAGEEKRTLRKSAFWTGDVTEKRTLRAGPHGKAHSGRPLACRMRLSVRVIPQNAPFRESDPQSASLRESPGAEWGTCVRRCDAIRRGVNPHEPPKSHIFGLCCGAADAAAHLGTPVALRLRTVGTAVAFDLLLETHKGTSSILPETERSAV